MPVIRGSAKVIKERGDEEQDEARSGRKPSPGAPARPGAGGSSNGGQRRRVFPRNPLFKKDDKLSIYVSILNRVMLRRCSCALIISDPSLEDTNLFNGS